MPGYDKKGPMGCGPMTGRKMGKCLGNQRDMQKPTFEEGKPGACRQENSSGFSDRGGNRTWRFGLGNFLRGL